MELIKAYSIPIKAPKDLMEEFFKLRKTVLDEVFKHIKYSKSGKAHLKFNKNDRKELRDKLLRNWRFAKHYVDSAINSVIGLVKGWIQLYNRGKAKSKPEITKKTVYVKTTLFTVRNGKIKITIEPKKRYLEVDLAKFNYLPKDYDSIGGLILQKDKLIITFKKRVELVEPKDYASFDVNLTNVTGLINYRIVRFDLRELYHIHRVYEEKRKRIQKLAKTKPKTAKKLMQKYSKRERNRVRDIMHKITTTIARELVSIKHGAILEDLKNIKDGILNGSKNLNRKLSKWNCRMFQSMLEYKLMWFGLPVKYVNPANSSKTCPVCSGRLSAYRDRLMKCDRCGLVQDRDVIAVLNLRMWGLGGYPEGGRALQG
ncbi:RNA-guided endonuclease InsQ/TnpB family protein [Archaeoglobus profundus]|uniref:Transposase, IS605 OrfB family n=1 Tax=Archaeoglobus profundus (strain DSM 5631 / JCM 9629 / NBRC 100127 / Av18) TaxID=572546 RepID=D2RGW4_ARCPA|nr:RNA-guided endonuclease TnpB family protein [Archaeoglobus profundus]ADB57539.1 transposase, IS605 OrfB family [Archaeoglobus profundus DSM 5631]